MTIYGVDGLFKEGGREGEREREVWMFLLGVSGIMGSGGGKDFKGDYQK